MNVSKELLERAKTTKSAEELLEMAKGENIELTARAILRAGCIGKESIGFRQKGKSTVKIKRKAIRENRKQQNFIRRY